MRLSRANDLLSRMLPAHQSRGSGPIQACFGLILALAFGPMAQAQPIDDPIIIGGPRSDVIETGALVAIDPSAIGLLDPGTGGLPASLWQGSEKAQIQALLPLLPVASASPAMNRLARRVLVSRGPAPAGLAAPGPSLLALKLDRLMAAGDLDALAGLVPLVAKPEADPEAARPLVDALLLLGRLSEAGSLAEKVSRASADPYWLKVQILALILTGDDARLDFVIGLARDSGADDKIFFTQVDVWRKQGKTKIKAEKLKDPSPLHLALARTLKLALPKDFFATTQPGLMRSFLINGEGDGATRAALIERLGTRALTSPAQLAELYAGIALKDDERTRPVDSALKANGARLRAILYQGGRTAPTTDGQAAAAAASLVLNGDPAIGALLAEANRGLVLSLPQAPILLAYAGALGRLAALGGDMNGAIRWLDGFRPQAPANSTAAIDLAGLTVLVAIGDPANARPLAADDLDRVLAKAATLPPDQRKVRIEALMACLWGLGLKPRPDSMFAGNSNGADPGLIQALKVSSEAGHMGETAILALALIGTAGPVFADPQPLEQALSCLVRVGLVAEARRIALEAVISHGL